MTNIIEQCKKVELEYGLIVYINSIGDYHNPTGPAIVYPDSETLGKGRVEYFVNGLRHREDGPAVIGYEKAGNVKYYKNDHLHNENGPAKIFYTKNQDGSVTTDEEWYFNGLRHREKDGDKYLPACVTYTIDKDGNEISRDESFFEHGKEVHLPEENEETVTEE